MDYLSFAALIYVTDREKEAVMRMYEWEKVDVEGDSQPYFMYHHPQKGAIIAAQQDEMGMTASATLTTKIILHFKPQYVIMPGIAAGVMSESADSQMYGDVILANMVWNYSNGKYVPKENASIVFGEIGFLPRPTVVKIDESLIPTFEKATLSVKNETKVHIGAIASGSTVVANKSILDKQIKGQFDSTQGLEMEAYGVAYAVSHSVEPKPKAIIAKSVCDFADSRKSDVYQKFAAYTSCQFVQFLLEEFL